MFSAPACSSARTRLCAPVTDWLSVSCAPTASLMTFLVPARPSLLFRSGPAGCRPHRRGSQPCQGPAPTGRPLATRSAREGDARAGDEALSCARRVLRVPSAHGWTVHPRCAGQAGVTSSHRPIFRSQEVDAGRPPRRNTRATSAGAGPRRRERPGRPALGGVLGQHALRLGRAEPGPVAVPACTSSSMRFRRPRRRCASTRRPWPPRSSFTPPRIWPTTFSTKRSRSPGSTPGRPGYRRGRVVVLSSRRVRPADHGTHQASHASST